MYTLGSTIVYVRTKGQLNEYVPYKNCYFSYTKCVQRGEGDQKTKWMNPNVILNINYV